MPPGFAALLAAHAMVIPDAVHLRDRQTRRRIMEHRFQAALFGGLSPSTHFVGFLLGKKIHPSLHFYGLGRPRSH
jgi:hypothetical protein